MIDPRGRSGQCARLSLWRFEFESHWMGPTLLSSLIHNARLISTCLNATKWFKFANLWCFKQYCLMRASIAQWIRLHLPFGNPWFESRYLIYAAISWKESEYLTSYSVYYLSKGGAKNIIWAEFFLSLERIKKKTQFCSIFNF